MKKLAFLLLILFSAASFAQELPRIAVYVTGDDVPANDRKALGTRMLSTIVNRGRYRAIERSDAFLAKLDEEHIKQRSGAIDDGHISELGRQFGVKFVCIADITPAFGDYQVSARIINVETAEVEFIGDASGALRSMSDLERISDMVVGKMFGEQVEQTVETRQAVAAGTTASSLSHQQQSVAVQSVPNFTAGERWATFGLNFVLPGGGSAIIMRDWTGAIVTWSALGVISIISGAIYTSPEDNHLFMEGFGAGIAITHFLITGGIWNAIRSITYDKKPPRTASSPLTAPAPSAGFNLAVFPGRHGHWQALAVYSRGF